MKAWLLSPSRVVPLSFLFAIVVGTLLLALPFASTDSDASGFMPALFTSVSAVCVTGLTTVDTATYWTPAGQAVILALVQVGGFGIMTLASILLIAIGRKLGLRNGLIAQAETHTIGLGDLKNVIQRLAMIVFATEAAVALCLFPRFLIAYDDDAGTAAWHAVFHAVSAFNNAGFSLYSDNLMPFVDDPWVIVPLCAAVIVGGLGFPVVAEIVRRGSPWSVHTRITVYGTVLLLVIGTIGFGLAEWTNEDTLGPLSVGGKLVAALSGGVMPRTAGFNTIDYGAATGETLMLTDILMFIGGGSAGTAGGIKVSTFFVLGFVIFNELRGEPDVTIFNRALPTTVQRQALTVALLAVGAVMTGTMAMMIATDYEFEPLLFESISAFATVGLSTGITFDMPPAGQLVLVALMFTGRVGVVTVGAALALSGRQKRYSLPEEHVIVG